MIHSIRQRSAWNEYVRKMGSEPGIVILSTGREGGKYVISGLRDPLGKDPLEVLHDFPSLAPIQVAGRWEAFQSLAPPFILIRAKRALDPPATVTLSFGEGTLRGHGTASASWINDACRIAPILPGVVSFDSQDVTPTDTTAAVLHKANDVLDPPPTVQLTFHKGVLTAQGSAPIGWANGCATTGGTHTRRGSLEE